MRALVTGAEGQLGRMLVARLGSAAVWAGGREALDVTDGAAVARTVGEVRPEVIFNAAAYNAVDAAEADPAAALAVNAAAPLHLALAAHAVGARLVHVSSDYVFDGAQRVPYAEDAPPRPVSVYGVSKLAGEMAVAAVSPANLVVRTSAVLGAGASRAKGGSFLERILSRARAGQPLRVVDDQQFSPTHAGDLAAAVVVAATAGLTGIVHVTNSGSCTWHDLSVAALADAGLDVPVERIASAALGLAARRPAYSVLANRRYTEAGLPPLRPWRAAVRELVRA